jgi:signal transduction histidine kinase
MFKQARIKLTGWYLLIIMMVSLAFTSVIYRASTFELNRFARAQQSRFESRILRPTPHPVDEELLEEAKSRILQSLIFINLGILVAAALLGYYLSGKTLEPISKMMDEQYRFVSDASHELKTPITAMKSTLEVALRDPDMKLNDAKQTLATSLEEVNSLQKLAEGLLELSSNNSQQIEQLNLDQIVHQSVKKLEPLAKSKKIEIQTKLKKVIIMGEPERLGRAITIILDNAIKYSKPKTKIITSVSVQGKKVLIKVKDHGVGIDSKDIPMIFNRFYRSDKARSTDGYGLGLSIAKKIVEDLNGYIKIESIKDRGTTVSMTFPYSARIQN